MMAMCVTLNLIIANTFIKVLGKVTRIPLALLLLIQQLHQNIVGKSTSKTPTKLPYRARVAVIKIIIFLLRMELFLIFVLEIR